MALKLITAPAAEPITAAEVQALARIGAGVDDVLIGGLITTERLRLDGRDGTLNRAIVTQTWELTLDCFPAGEILLPLPPLQSVASITYTDAAGDEQTLDPAAYRVDILSEPGRVLPAIGGFWPATQAGAINAVAVRFVAGYGDAAAVPAGIKTALQLRVQGLYDGEIAPAMERAADALLELARFKSLA